MGTVSREGIAKIKAQTEEEKRRKARAARAGMDSTMKDAASGFALSRGQTKTANTDTVVNTSGAAPQLDLVNKPEQQSLLNGQTPVPAPVSADPIRKPRSVTGWSANKLAGADSAQGAIARRARAATETAAGIGPSTQGYSFGAAPDNPNNFAKFKDSAGRSVTVNNLGDYFSNPDRPTAGRGSFNVMKMGPTDEQMAKTDAEFNANYDAEVERAKRLNMMGQGKITKYSRNRPRGVSNEELQAREDKRVAGIQDLFKARDTANQVADTADKNRAAISADAAAKNKSAETVAKMTADAATVKNKQASKGLSSQAMNLFKSKVDDGMGGQQEVFDHAGAVAATKLKGYLPNVDDFTVSSLALEAMQHRKDNPGKAPTMEAIARLINNPDMLPDFEKFYGYRPQLLSL